MAAFWQLANDQPVRLFARPDAGDAHRWQASAHAIFKSQKYPGEPGVLEMPSGIAQSAI
jgi:hypothetical protein